MDLRNRSVQGLMLHQGDILREYKRKILDSADPPRDVAIELPTGSGKTLVGLLIGEYRRRALEERVLYLCPTKQLVHQVVAQARQKYGIKALPFVGAQSAYDPSDRSDYLFGRAIAVSTYSGLFNSNPFFSNPDTIILDDAHVAENYMAAMWSLELPRSEYPEVYESVIRLLKDRIPDYQHDRMLAGDPTPNDRAVVDKVPTPVLMDISRNLIALLDTRLREKRASYSWNAIRDHLAACHLYFCWDGILLRPIIPPTMTHRPFAEAKQRLYMSATLGKAGDLERSTGVKRVSRLSIPGGWDRQGVGRRLFFFPELSLTRDETDSLVLSMIKKVPRALILVPDSQSALKWRELVASSTDYAVLGAQDIETSKDPFVTKRHAVAVLANRLDGIDFPEEECRLLIVSGYPRATNLQERFLQSRMAAAFLLRDRIKARVQQAIGRCTRSATDYSAVCVLGAELSDTLLHKEDRTRFHPELQAELDFGRHQCMDTSADEMLDNLRIFLEHGDDWDAADSEIVQIRTELTARDDPAAEKLRLSVEHEVAYAYAIWRGDYPKAIEECDSSLAALVGDDVKGYRGFWNYLAGCAARLGSQAGLVHLEQVAVKHFHSASACSDSVGWFRALANDQPGQPEEEQVVFERELVDVIERLEAVLDDMGTSSPRRFEKEASEILELLSSTEAKKFEAGQVKLGTLLGYKSSNTDGKAGPDPWWIASDTVCLVSEETWRENELFISVNKARQAATHESWIRGHLADLSPNATVVTVFITNATAVDAEALTLTPNLYYWGIPEFRTWAAHSIDVVRSLRSQFPGPGDIIWRALAMEKYREHAMDPLSLVTAVKDRPLSKLEIRNH